MATAVLIAGFVLALPPLVLFRKMWQGRGWLLYLAEVLGALCLAAGSLLKGVPWGLAAGVLWAVGLGITFPLFAGRGKRTWVVLVTGLLVTGIIGAAGYGVLRSRFGKTKMSKASEGDAVKDFRRAGGALKSAVEGTPPAGVYQYSAIGEYSVSVTGLGTDKRVLPKTLPAVLVSKDRCWTLDIRFFKKHLRKVHYCADKDGGLRMAWLVNHNEFFGLKHHTKSRCEPDLIWHPSHKKGHSTQQKCAPVGEDQRFGKTNAQAEWDYMGAETLTIGKLKRKVHHMRRTLVVKSLQSARVVQHLYYDDQNKMLVRYRVKGGGSGLATFKSDYQITLTRMAPKK